MHRLYVGVASMIDEANMCNTVTLQPIPELNGRTTNNYDDQNNSKNLGIIFFNMTDQCTCVC